MRAWPSLLPAATAVACWSNAEAFLPPSTATTNGATQVIYARESIAIIQQHRLI